MDCFPTVFQDILANEIGSGKGEAIGWVVEDPEVSVLQQLDEHSFDLLNEFNEQYEKNCLTLAKFMCTGKFPSDDKMEVEPEDLYASWSTAGSYKAPILEIAAAQRSMNPSSAFMVKMFHVLEESLI